jgi:hypothetical protein
VRGGLDLIEADDLNGAVEAEYCTLDLALLVIRYAEVVE